MWRTGVLEDSPGRNPNAEQELLRLRSAMDHNVWMLRTPYRSGARLPPRENLQAVKDLLTMSDEYPRGPFLEPLDNPDEPPMQTVRSPWHREILAVEKDLINSHFHECVWDCNKILSRQITKVERVETLCLVAEAHRQLQEDLQAIENTAVCRQMVDEIQRSTPENRRQDVDRCLTRPLELLAQLETRYAQELQQVHADLEAMG